MTTSPRIFLVARRLERIHWRALERFGHPEHLTSRWRGDIEAAREIFRQGLEARGYRPGTDRLACVGPSPLVAALVTAALDLRPGSEHSAVVWDRGEYGETRILGREQSGDVPRGRHGNERK